MLHNTHNKLTSAFITLSFALVFSVTGTAVADVDKLVKECADCHGDNGNSKTDDAPSIAGMSVTYFTESMAAYKTDARPALKLKDKKEDMKNVVKKLSDADVKALAAHYAKQKFVPFKQKFDAAKAKEGKKLHTKYCDKCHSSGGASAEDDAGILAGQPSGYVKYSLDNYASGKREMGKKMAKKFNKMLEKDGKESLDSLIHYYASQQ